MQDFVHQPYNVLGMRFFWIFAGFELKVSWVEGATVEDIYPGVPLNGIL